MTPSSVHRILVPTDGSPSAERAFAHAAFLADRYDAELHVFHARPEAREAGGVDDTFDLSSLVTDSELPEGIARVDVLRDVASVPEAIVAYARDVDLIVMGTHGRRGLRRLVAGSTTEFVVRHADCPVLAVRQGAERTTPVSVQRVLMPVDFSTSSESALAAADALAAIYGARVDVIHAVQFPSLPDVYGAGPHFEADYPQVVARVREALGVLVEHTVAPARRGDVVARIDSPVPMILGEAERLATGLLVMPTHGRTGLARAALGSVAEAVLRRAPCAVVSLPAFGRVPDLRPPAHASERA